MNEIIEAHYRENYRKLVALLTQRMGHHNAEDVVQEAYTRALMYCKNVEDFENWFASILRSRQIEHGREETMHGAVSMPLEEYEDFRADTLPDPERSLLMARTVRELARRIERKPENIRNILTMFFLRQMDAKDITKLVPESYANIRHIISRFRTELREDGYADGYS